MAGGVVEEACPAQAGVAFPTVRVENPELGPATRRPEAVARHGHRRSLADDVSPEPDPGLPLELEPQPRRLGHRSRETRRQPRRLEDDEQRAGAPGKCRETPEPIRQVGPRPCRRGLATRQIDDEKVHRSPGKERARDRQALVEGLGIDEEEPLELDAAGDGLDRIEAPGEVEPGDDRTGRLGLGGEPEREGRLARRSGPPQGHAGSPRQPAGTEDRVECGEACRDDPPVGEVWLGREVGLDGLPGGPRRCGGEGERAADGSCGTPSRLERREGLGHVPGGAHQAVDIRTCVIVSSTPCRVQPAGLIRSHGSLIASTLPSGSRNHAARSGPIQAMWYSVRRLGRS